ncbi:MAG: DUF1320 family protein [Armatimonadetes bacterium]|nr:DUF1320 family protein [Armatimonadota bacterium]
MTQYCQIEDVKVYLPNNIVVEGDNATPDPYNPEPANLTVINIEFFIQQATQRINALIRTVYDVPLKKINQGGTVAFPDPVPAVCAILAAQMVYEQKLMGAERETSEPQKRREEWAENMMTRLQNGEVVLEGQRRTRSSRFISNTLRGAPRNPAVEGRSKGNQG